MTILNLGQASARLGFKIPVTLRKMLKRGVLDAYVCEGPDKRATYLEIDPVGLPTLEQQLKNHLQFHINSTIWHQRREPGPTASDEAMAPIDQWIESRSDWTIRAAEFIDDSCWGPPPWSAQQWRNLRAIIQLAEDG